MDKALIINQIVQALCEAVKVNQDSKIILQQIHFANRLVQGISDDHESIKALFGKLLEMNNNGLLCRDAYVTVLMKTAQMMKNQIAFEESCIYVLNETER